MANAIETARTLYAARMTEGGVGRMIIIAILLALTTPANAQQQKPVDPIAKLADQLFLYGVAREAHDRLTFPKNIPKQPGEYYDWSTGNTLPHTVHTLVNAPN